MYEWIKVLHIISFISWFAGLFYLPRLYVYHVENADHEHTRKTLEIMEKEHSWEKITSLGRYVNSLWTELADEHSLDISISGLPALTTLSFNSQQNLKYKTLITQECLKKGILASNVVYTCLAHSEELIDQYSEALKPVFSLIAECEDGRNIDELLDNGVCESGFGRYN